MRMKYRATFTVQCDCGAQYGVHVENFECKSNTEAGKKCRQITKDHSPEKGHQGIRWLLREFKRIDQEEITTVIYLDGTEKEPQ